MFHVNEADNGQGVLTVTDDGMTIHMSLASKKIANLYAGLEKPTRREASFNRQPTR